MKTSERSNVLDLRRVAHKLFVSMRPLAWYTDMQGLFKWRGKGTLSKEQSKDMKQE